MSNQTKAIQIKGGEYSVAGYGFFDIHFPMDVKPKDGFVYVVLPGGDIGAIQKSEIENWDDLPLVVSLHEKLQNDKIEALKYQGLI